MVKVLTASETERMIPPELTDGLAMQDIDTEHRIFRTPGYNSGRTEDKYTCEANSRILAQNYAKTITDEIIILMDSDVMLLKPNALSLLIEHISSIETCGIAALWFGRIKKKTTKLTHVDIKCCAIRREIFVSVDYLKRPKTTCLCDHTRKTAESMGYYAEYINFYTYAKELSRKELK